MVPDADDSVDDTFLEKEEEDQENEPLIRIFLLLFAINR